MEQMALASGATGSQGALTVVQRSGARGSGVTVVVESEYDWYVCLQKLGPFMTLPGSGSTVNVESVHTGYAFAENGLLAFMGLIAPQQLGTNAMGAREILEFIRASLGISIAELARFGRATRPTVYSWLGGQTPRADSQRRLNQLKRLVGYWNQICEWPVRKYIDQALDQGVSLADILQEDPLDEHKAKVAMHQIRELIVTARSTKERSSIAGRLRTRGLKPLAHHESDATIDGFVPNASIASEE